jgi:hypothetical protein
LKQTAEQVIASLFKQLVYLLGGLPSNLKSIYDSAMYGRPRPLLSAFIDEFLACAQESFIVVFFDAFDECQVEHRGLVISKIVRRLIDSGIKVFITTRHHTLQDLPTDLEGAIKMEIKAHSSDIERYITQRLQDSTKANRLDGKFKAKIIKEINDRADGM